MTEPKRNSSSDEAEDFTHSAILAKHGISYNMGPSDENRKSTTVCRDAADRILDAMDQQLGDFTLLKSLADDVNDDPGTDPDSVRSLRNRVMSDLASANHKNSNANPNYRDMHHENSSKSHKTVPKFSNTPDSRFEHKDDSRPNGLPTATQKALASSLDRLNLGDERNHQPVMLSARVAPSSRRGRDNERLRDRKRLNESRSSWETPSTLSLRDLNPPTTRSKSISSSEGKNSAKHEFGNVTMISGNSSFQSPKQRENIASGYQRPLSYRWHSTPINLNARGRSASPYSRRVEPMLQHPGDRKYFQKVKYEDDFVVTEGSMKSSTHKNVDIHKNRHLPKENEKQNSGKKCSSSSSHTSRSSKEASSVNLQKTKKWPVDKVLPDSLSVHQLSTPEKRDQYEWRMRKMLTELDISSTQINDLFPKEDASSAGQESTSGEKENRRKQISTTSGSPSSSDDVILSKHEAKDETKNMKVPIENDNQNHPAVSEVYAKTDYHEVPNFPETITSDTKTTPSISTEQIQTEEDARNGEVPKLKSHDSSEEVSSSDKSTKILNEDVSPKQVADDLEKCASVGIASSSKSSSSPKEDFVRRVSSHVFSSTESDPEDIIRKQQDNGDLRLMSAAESLELDKTLELLDEKNAVKTPESVSEDSTSKRDHKITVTDDSSSVQSDSTLVADESGVGGKSSLRTNDIPSVFRESLVKIPSDDRSSLEFTLHVSSTDIETLPTSEFEENWNKRQKNRFPEVELSKHGQQSTEKTKSSDLTPRSKKKLTYRDRMKIALSAHQRRVDRISGQSSKAEKPVPKRRYSLGSDSRTSVATDDLINANPDCSNSLETPRQNQSGGRSNLPRSNSVASLSTVHTEEYEDKYKQMLVRHIAGVPVTSFDGVTIASDLDSINTDNVREHFKESLRKNKDSTKPTSQESTSLRDRYNRLKDCENQPNGTGNGLETSYSTRPARSPLKASYRNDTTFDDEKSDNGLNGTKVSQNNDSLISNDSILNHNGVLPSRHRSSSSQQTKEQRQQAFDSSSRHRSPSKTSSRHNRARSMGPTSRREHLMDSMDTYANNNHDSSGSIEPSRSMARVSQRSDSVESGNERRRLTSTALGKLKELDSQIEIIENKKKSSEQELKLMEKTIEGHRISLLKLEEKLRENQAKADDARTELMVLEFKKDQCRKELESTSKELNDVQEKVKDSEDLGMTYDEMVAVIQERDDLRARFRRGEASKTTIAERQELERALHAAREEIFRERKSKREQLEELEDKLEDVEHNYETMETEKKAEIQRLKAVIHDFEKNQSTGKESQIQAVERANAIEAEKRSLHERIESLTNQLQQKDKEIVSLATESNRSREEIRRLQEKLTEMDVKVTEQISLREKLIAEAERNANSLKKDKELALASIKGEKQNEIEKILQDIEKDKSRALLECKSEHQEEICKLRSIIESKDKEIEKLRERLHHEEDAKRELGEKLRTDAQEQIRDVLAKERLSWENEKQVTDQREEELRKANFDKEKTKLASEIEEARSKCKIATEQISRLRTEIEELRLENRKLMQEKLDAVSHAREQERKDQSMKLDQLRVELEEINQSEITKHRSKYAKIEEALRKTKQEKHDALLKCKEVNSHAERSERCFVAEIHDECQKIADLIRGIRTPSQSRNRSSAIGSRSGSHLSRSTRPTNAEGSISQLRTLSDDVRATLRDLTTEVETHRRAAHIAQRERDQAKSSGASSTNSKQLSQQIAELNGQNSSDMKVLSKQLSEKDNELRDIQRNMSMWKDTTAQKLAEKFEEELAVQLERKLTRHRIEHKRQLERMEEEIARLSAGNNSHHMTMHHEFDPSSSLVPPISSTPVKVATPSGNPGDKGTVKLLRHLQGRVKQLRAENDLLRSNSQIMDYEGFRKSR